MVGRLVRKNIYLVLKMLDFQHNFDPVHSPFCGIDKLMKFITFNEF